MSRLLFVVHRYYPFPGGSEYYVRDMAEEALKRGHDVTVLAHEHQGDQNGVKVTNDYQVLNQSWNLIIVHGGDCVSQNIVHYNAAQIRSPVLYMLIKPSKSDICMHGLRHHRFIGISTSMDIEHCREHYALSKVRRVRHGVVPESTIVPKLWSPRKNMIFVSAGGYYPHKAMIPLANAFEASNIPDAELHLYGYGEGAKPNSSSKVKVNFGSSREDVMSAIANADAYIMNSHEEGFGLVLLEAMMNKTPWYARRIAGAQDMKKYGYTYENENELIEMLRKHDRIDKDVNHAYDYVMSNHTITDTVSDIEDILLEIM
jgi:glycosyltransferase involved in cell wall biosynthesis